jgi:hypothetical protein
MKERIDDELRAVAYYSIGVCSEGKDVAYQVSFASNTLCAANEYLF